MQHPDEGTIHSWLDNALSVEEAARVESHVAGCPQCAAAVAEARGFIAASSRILTALDDVPRGVVPAAPARKRDLRVLWRAAAAVLVVAGGSLVVMRDGGQKMRSPVAIADSVVESTAPSTAADVAATAETGALAQAPQPDASQASESDSKRRATSQTVRPSGPRSSVALSAKGPPQVMSGSGRDAVAQAAPADLAVPAMAPRNEAQFSGIVVGELSGVAPLKELSLERTLGRRRIVYQISPTDTVILTELELSSLQSVVVTGAASAQDRQQKALRTRDVAPMRPETVPAAPPPVAAPADSGRADSVAVSAEGAMMTQAAGAIRLRGATSSPAQNTLRWVESATGKTLILSGKLPIERLQEIRQRIEIERAAARKKSP
ncbi:MAG: zf-HC2 domain-containing protein [Gemmatimonadaceae bacterium]